MNITTLLLAAEGILFIAFGVPLAISKIPPNRLYGFRTNATLNNAAI